MNLLAADIGATNSRLAWISGEETHTESFRNADFSDLYQVIARFLQDQGALEARISRMVLALPGPPDAECVTLTNIDWQVERKQLASRFRVEDIVLLNDFQAAAVGAIHSNALVSLNPAGTRALTGTAVVTGAGTGLGMAWCNDVSEDELPVATEGGHVDFAPLNREQYGLHEWLSQRYGHVSCERILCGDGLRDMYRFFSAGMTDTPTAEEISQAAGGKERIAMQVVRCFVTVLGQYAGNLALQFNPGAGVYLCGGVVSHLSSWIEQGFTMSYLDKGRMRGQVSRIPAYLVREQQIGLMGAIRIARGVLDGPSR